MVAAERTEILLVEDEAIIALDEANRLEQDGYVVRSVRTGESALEKIRNGSRVDLVLMDLNLGRGMSGIEAARRIQEHRELPVVFLTAYADPETVEAVSKVTRYGYVLKNSGHHILLQAVEMALDLFRSRAETEAQAARLRALINTSPDVILLCGPDHRLLEANPAAEELFGFDRSRYRGDLVESVAGGLAPPLQKSFLSLAAPPANGRASRWDTSVPMPGGTERIYDVIQAEMDGRAEFLTLAREVTERSRAEQQSREKTRQLQQLSRHLEQTREEQNRYIAREIHDELGQALTSMDILLTMGEQDLRTPEKEKEELEGTLKEVREILHSTSITVRNLVKQLRPTILDHLGLSEAVRWESEEFERRTGIIVTFEAETSAPPPIENRCALSLFRILQESLTNVSRHANAKSLVVRLMEKGDELQMEIRDDGVGFEPEEAARKGRFGLLGMEERALSCGGTLEVKASPGTGTSILVTVPMEKEA